MVGVDQHLLSFVIRAIHVASMAVLIGGALLVWALSIHAPVLDTAEHHRLLRFAAERYEYVFWASVGLLVMTGVGNLGAFGGGLPSPGTAWGTKLLVKLSAVLILLVLSLVRSLVVSHLALAAELPLSARGRRIVQASYAGTTIFAMAILALAVSLRYG